MKKILIALLGVLTLFACSQDELGNINGKQEISLVKNSEFKIYSGKHDWLADAASTRAMSAHSKKAMTGDVTVPEGAIDLTEAWNNPENVRDNRFILKQGFVYFVPAGKTFDHNLDVSAGNGQGGNMTATIYVAGKMIVPGGHNGTADFDITVLKDGELYWDWNNTNNGNLYIGNGGAARIECYGKIGTTNNGQTTTDINDVTLKGGSYLNLYKGGMEKFVVNGKFLCEQNNSKVGELYSDIPVEIKGEGVHSDWGQYAFTSNSASYVFNDKFLCEGDMLIESHSELYFNGCANIAGTIKMNGESDLYVNKYLNAGKIYCDQGRIHLYKALLDAGMIQIPFGGGNAYIESAATSAGNSKKKTLSSDNLSEIECGTFMIKYINNNIVNYKNNGNLEKTDALRGNIVIKCDQFQGGDQYNPVNVNTEDVQVLLNESVAINPDPTTYSFEKPNCDEEVPPTPDPVYYDLIVKVIDGQEGWGTVKTTEYDIPEGEFRTFSATPNEGYEFVQWTDGDTNAERTVKMDSDKEFTAIFKEQENNTPDPEDPYNNPKKPEYYENKAHVEVNLSVNDEKETGDYIATKLSIHVRDTTDVEVFIPVGADYYCPADDMYIVELHDSVYVYNELTEKTQIQVAGQTVTLTVKFENGGIRVTTDGVNAEVLKYCRENFGDGITFEVWNYYKDNTTRDELKPMLDASTIKFLDNEPDYYINAFAKLRDYKDPIYNKYNEETGEWTLYTDEACTQELGSQYWKRTEGGYEIFGDKNPWDCVVLPTNTNNFKTYIEGEYNKNYSRFPETEE